ncbi:MAG: response regulator [Deltaproteobacteria bacterium]|jgi:PAS domain S-box-containing protein|nr:response regulator [Deltaproteobacteria bacterium]
MTVPAKLLSLRTFINGRLERLKRSQVSLDVFHSILDGMDSLIYVTDPETGNILFVNNKLRELHGLAAEVVGRPCWEVMPQGFSGRCDFCRVPALMNEPGRAIVWESQSTRNGRFYRHTDRLIDWPGRAKAHLRQSTDITQIRESELARGDLEASLLRLSAIVNNSPQVIMYINMDGRFEYFNQGTLDLLGYGAQDLKDGGLARIVDEKTYRVLRGEIIPHVIHGLKNNFELSVVKKSGEKRLMSFSAFKAGTTAMGIGVIAHDVTEHRAMERELIAARDQAEQSSKAKGEFLSRMSHEMRTPMNAIIGMTNIAKNSREAEKKEYCLDKIADASHHLLGVINDILDMSKIEANKFELSFTEFNFEKMLLRVLGVINFRVEEKKQNLIVKVDPAMPRFVVSDEQRLAQVIANLLSNAVKFTPDKGTVSLCVKVLEDSERGCGLQISVADTGIGISPDQQRRLFRSFEQADGGIARKFGGTGLGLVISKSIVELLHGRIWVESVIDRGATFSFVVPVQKGENARQSLFSPSINRSELRLLAVDDAPDVLEFFGEFAASAGLECALASSGEAALETLDKNAGRDFNLLFVDWKMPGLDGLELARRIRALPQTGAARLVIMISGADWLEIENEARQAGVDRFVAKPLFASSLVDCINQCLGLEGCEISPAPSGAEAARPGDMRGCFSGRRILLAEDMAINSEIVISLLEDTGISIDCAQNGLEALSKFSENPGTYDLILMDIHMPEVDGYEATRRIRGRRSKEAENIPIVAMTANVFREDIEKCLAAGMNDHIGKPVDLGEIMAKLLKWLPGNRARG